MRGLVIKNTGSWYTVLTDDGQLIECKIKGNFRLKGIRSTNPVAVGDRVEIVPLAANVDQAILVVTVVNPQTSTTFIDRFLASAEAYRVPVILVFNKTDLLDEDTRRYQEAMVHLYQTIGYECYQISAETGAGVEALQPLLKDKITLLSGNSGVGKSTLINRLVPGASQRTGAWC